METNSQREGRKRFLETTWAEFGEQVVGDNTDALLINWPLVDCGMILEGIWHGFVIAELAVTSVLKLIPMFRFINLKYSSD